jgi:DNA polymerase III epsilon subunit-like protein
MAESNNLIFIDTETTGLIPYYKSKIVYPGRYKLWNSCRIVQIAWIICDEKGNVINTHDYLIAPNDFIIPEESTRVHGITQEEAEKKGKLIEDVLILFLNDLKKSKLIIAHNIEFDYNVILSEIYRYKVKNQDVSEESFMKKNKYCTMLKGTQKGKKWPKLCDLYEEYFKHTPSLRLHSALNDTLVCKDIYYFQQKLHGNKNF